MSGTAWTVSGTAWTVFDRRTAATEVPAPAFPPLTAPLACRPHLDQAHVGVRPTSLANREENPWQRVRSPRPNPPRARLGAAAGVPDVHAHRWRHSFAHEWKRAGGDTGDLMLLPECGPVLRPSGRG